MPKSCFRWLGILGLLTALSACGFQLRGLGAPLRPMPFKVVYIQGDGAIANTVTQMLNVDKTAIVTRQMPSADAILNVSDVSETKDIQTINRGGRINEYLLTLTLDASLSYPKLDAIVPIKVEIRRSMNYADSEVLGKTLEEDATWANMRQEAAMQLVRRLGYIPVPNEKKSNTSQPVGEVNATH